MEERFEYLSLKGSVGRSTFGFDRWLNQQFYNSYAWRKVRTFVIARDNGCDLGLIGQETNKRLTIHHMNPIDVEDLARSNPDILDPEYLVSCTHDTHNAIHYGDSSLLAAPPVERYPGDTVPWRRRG
jgi:hypothetical protein